jgi:hypothetical protein
MTINRRQVLLGSSLCTILAAKPALGITLSTTRATMSPTPTPASASPLPYTSAAGFNKGRSQVNLNFLQIGGDYPFLNCLKTAQSWGLADNSGPPDPKTLDKDGYPVTITNGGVYTVFFVPSQAVRPGNYVITWQGNGTVYCGMSTVPVSGSTTCTGGSGRYVFATKETRFVIGISAIGSPRISNLQVFHEKDEAALNSGQIFGAKFKERLIEANFGVIRFLNWQSGNTTNVTTWATRKPISYVFYAGSEFRPALYAGLTASKGNAYYAQLGGFQLSDKATVTVKFNASCNGPCTLNVSGTGDINVLSEYATPLSVGGNSFPIGGTWQSIATLVYDATLNAWIKQGGDVAIGSVGLDNGCPPELMVRLCAEIGAHPYFVTPPLAIDPATDYIPSLAAYCRDNAPSWMIPRFEGPNELWNYAGGFYQTWYAVAKATAYGWGGDVHNWYGKVMSVLGQAVSAAYRDDRQRYQVLCGVQTGLGLSGMGTASCNPRLASNNYLAQSTDAQPGYTKTAAFKWVTHVSIAVYYNPVEQNTPQEDIDASKYAASAGDAATQMAIAVAYANTANGAGGLLQNANVYANWKTWAKSFGISKMCSYEGGYSPDYNGSPAVNALRAASKLAPPLYNLTTINYNSFVSLSDASFTAEFPSCFQLSGMTAPNSTAWSVLEDIYQSPAPPQWSAIVAFNRP